MLRGFTLLEMLITIFVMSALLFFATPNLYRLQQKQKMVHLAAELQGFLIMAKSEAVFRNKDLWAHIERDGNPSLTGDWSIRVTDSALPGEGEAIQMMSGKKYRDIWFQSNYVSDQIKFDGIRGKVNNGSINMALLDAPEKSLSLRSSFGASRIIVCGDGGAFYGYPQCD